MGPRPNLHASLTCAPGSSLVSGGGCRGHYRVPTPSVGDTPGVTACHGRALRARPPVLILGAHRDRETSLSGAEVRNRGREKRSRVKAHGRPATRSRHTRPLASAHSEPEPRDRADQALPGAPETDIPTLHNLSHYTYKYNDTLSCIYRAPRLARLPHAPCSSAIGHLHRHRRIRTSSLSWLHTFR